MDNETKFELTADEIAYIKKDYEADENLIGYVAEKINNSNIVGTEEDFKDLVVECISEYISRIEDSRRRVYQSIEMAIGKSDLMEDEKYKELVVSYLKEDEENRRKRVLKRIEEQETGVEPKKDIDIDDIIKSKLDKYANNNGYSK